MKKILHQDGMIRGQLYVFSILKGAHAWETPGAMVWAALVKLTKVSVLMQSKTDV